MKKPARVLIVDDEDNFHKEMEFSFGKEFEFIHALSVKEAEAIIEKEGEKINLFLIDLNLDPSHEDLTGLDLISFLKKRLPEIARIAVTSVKRSYLPDGAFEKGADCYLHKDDFDLFKWKSTLNEFVIK